MVDPKMHWPESTAIAFVLKSRLTNTPLHKKVLKTYYVNSKEFPMRGHTTTNLLQDLDGVFYGRSVVQEMARVIWPNATDGMRTTLLILMLTISSGVLLSVLDRLISFFLNITTLGRLFMEF